MQRNFNGYLNYRPFVVFSLFPEFYCCCCCWYACGRFNIPWGVTKFQSWLKVMRWEKRSFYCFVFFAADSSCLQLSMALWRCIAQNNWKRIANKFKLCIFYAYITYQKVSVLRRFSTHVIMLAKYCNVCIAYDVFLFSFSSFFVAKLKLINWIFQPK